MRAWIILSVLLGLPVLVGAQTSTQTAWDKGLAWLITHQKVDGSWRSASGTEFPATASAVEAFGKAGVKSFSYAQGVSWLSNSHAPSVDSLTRQILALKGAQVNVTSLDNKLGQWMNWTGTWGAYKGFETSFPDTPLGLKAQGTISTQGLCQILTAQKSGDATVNGSWSYILPASGAPVSAINSAILPTTANILGLDLMKSTVPIVTCSGITYTLQTAIDNGISWLLTQKKKADGGFGDDSASTAVATAFVYEVLRDLRPTDPATDAALNYLLTNQSADGSWNSDALKTAFALKVLPPPATAYVDTDKDGVPDAIEIVLGTNPNVPDSKSLGKQSISSASVSGVKVLSNESLSTQSSSSSSSTGSADGDINRDGLADVADLALAEQFALGLAVPTQDQLSHGDVFPAGSPDGVIDMNDVERIRRKVLGLEAF